MRLSLLFIPLIAFLAFTVPVNTGVLSGHVTDENKEDLIGASVAVYKDSLRIKGTSTDVDGKYSLRLDPGVYTIEVTYSGFAAQRQSGIRVEENKITALDFTMKAGETLSEVVVVGNKLQVKESRQSSMALIVPSKQAKYMPSHPMNAIVGKTAGNTSMAPAVKGARHTPTNYYIDGVRVADKKKQLEKKAQKSYNKTEITPEASEEQYNAIVENPFQNARQSNISTFSIDVDRASYANIRRFINNGLTPPKDAVRIEEMVNYFNYDYQKPAGRHPFEVNAEVAPCPWEPEHRLLMLGLKGIEPDFGQLPPSNLVFLIDVSGSMSSQDKLPLLKSSLEFLADQLRPHDRVAMVVYAGAAGLALESTAGSDKTKIKEALGRLEAGGSTAGAAGIKLAYETARKNFIPKGNNRVILCTDGDFNVGVSSQEELEKMIEAERSSGIYLTVLGFGTGNYQDGKMQTLADKGNGNHAYIDQLSEAKKVLGQEFGATLFTIAKDVKLQLHFNPELVAGYRLIGYENRMLATEDFHDDTKDAGELGAGHCVTAFYELIPAGGQLPSLSTLDSALVVTQKADTAVALKANDLMVLQLRYKKPEGSDASTLMEYRLNAAALDHKGMSENYMLASAVVEFGLLLRDSKHKGKASFEAAIRRAKTSLTNDPDGYRAELVKLMEAASARIK